VIYFKEPYRTNMTEWTEEHLDFDEDIVIVVAYSKDYQKLKEIRGNYRKYKFAFIIL